MLAVYAYIYFKKCWLVLQDASVLTWKRVIVICTDEKRLIKQLLLFKSCVDLEGDMSLKVKGTLNMPKMQINQLFVKD